ncbi:hypothetical protein P7K49_001521 [Saguinus oedipus]|uniref:Uncharacterized protein n=1 Tax=Saguinus oedipus TaxID=9490 RepID=A0ABQ9WFC1_SAGOE|nr:hypothetical protein P7K49_001521 [Saguinus oedipus]
MATPGLPPNPTTKCHQYWPDPPDVMDHGSFHIQCQSEDCTIAYVSREMLVTNTQTGEEHTVTHLQYVAWPDHGVPDDSSDFLEFVNYVRSLRVDNEPILVHCSAGIGRTGVLVTMETAMCLTERNLPVYPLDIVRKMRDQRAMMVQTSVSSWYLTWIRNVHSGEFSAETLRTGTFSVFWSSRGLVVEAGSRKSPEYFLGQSWAFRHNYLNQRKNHVRPVGMQQQRSSERW